MLFGWLGPSTRPSGWTKRRVMWSAEDSDVIVDLTKDDDALPPVKQEE
jgi:hypothetical protein